VWPTLSHSPTGHAATRQETERGER
jgi:hypothetical protein